MKEWMSLAETARRLGVSRRSVWEAMLEFAPRINAVVGSHGRLEFHQSVVENLSLVFSARRKGWTDQEIGEWLAQAVPGQTADPPAPPSPSRPEPGARVSGAGADLTRLDRFLELALRPVLRQLDQLRAELDAIKGA